MIIPRKFQPVKMTGLQLQRKKKTVFFWIEGL